MPTIKGVWTIDYNAVITETILEPVNFVANRNNYVSMGIQYKPFAVNLYYDDTDIAQGVHTGVLDTWMDGMPSPYQTVNFGTTEQEVSDGFYAWFTANATQQAGASITYNGSTIASLEAGQTATLSCEGEKAKTDISINFYDGGSITYNGKTTNVERGKTATLQCAGNKMRSDVYVTVAVDDSTIVGTWVLNDTLTEHANATSIPGNMLSITGTITSITNDKYEPLSYDAKYLFTYIKETVIGTANTLTSGHANLFKSNNTQCYWGSFYQEVKKDNKYSAHYATVRTVTITECDSTQEHYQYWCEWFKANATKVA